MLDIGSGWGGLGLYLSETSGAEVTGVTLSAEQHKVSQDRVKERGVDGHVGSSCRITGTKKTSTTGSSRWACLNMLESGTTTNFSTK